jgi:alcohol dehydrogenase (NADP+)
MSLPKTFTLANGAEVPAVGLGTFQGDAGNELVGQQVTEAIRVGYRHIDTAARL